MKKHVPNERTEQNPRKRTKQNGDKQSTKCRFQNTGYKEFFYYDHLVNFSLYAGPTFYYTFKKVETKRMHNEGTKNNKWKIAL